VVANGEVWLGNYPTVPLICREDVAITLPRSVYSKVKMEVVYQGPFEVPLQKDTKLATLFIHIPGEESKTFDLFASHNVESANFFKRIPAAINYLIWGKNS
jgi:D-alanyl-D-alanine carboxypeptidase (penicillin-binding protein 5/6)